MFRFAPIPHRALCFALPLVSLLPLVGCSADEDDLSCGEAAAILAGCDDADSPECAEGSPAVRRTAECARSGGKADWLGNRTWGDPCIWNWQCQQDTKHTCIDGKCYRRASEGNACDPGDDDDCARDLACGQDLSVPSEPGGICSATGETVAPPLYAETIRPHEESDFRDHAFDIAALQLKAVTERLNGDDQFRRAFHSKRHACLVGEFEVFEGPEDLQVGPVFGAPQVFPAWVRLSNGTLTMTPDDDSNIQGLALKLMNVEGPKVLQGARDAITQDFLMVNLQANIVSNANDFVEFSKATSRGGLFVAHYFLTHPRITARALSRVIGRDKPDSVRTETFWSSNARKHGPIAVKYSARPCPGVSPARPTEGPDRLRDELELSLASEDLCYDVFLQRQLDPVEQSIEDSAQIWDESASVPVRMARVTAQATHLSDPAVQDIEQQCNALAFDPWHTAEDYRPLGHMNRARRAAYEASRGMRAAAPEPTTIPQPVPAE